MMLLQGSKEHYSYQLAQEKKHHLVIRGLYESMDTKRIKEQGLRKNPNPYLNDDFQEEQTTCLL